MIVFLLKSTACMLIFLTFYKVLLENESMHHFKRFFLIAALVSSFIIPSIVFTEYIEIEPTSISTQVLTMEPNGENQNIAQAVEQSPLNWSLILWTVYGIGVVGFGFRFIRHLFQIWSRIRSNPKLKRNSITNVLLQEQLPPHTFFSFIFLNKHKFETKNIPDSVLLHEETHALQKHSLDVLFIEVLQMVFWFNPVLYFFKKSIKLNHEFLADSAVLKNNEDQLNYQHTLLSYLSNGTYNTNQSIGIANAINYSSIKKRFIIMKKQTSKKRMILRSTLLLPLLAILLFSFSETQTLHKGEKADLQFKSDISIYNTLARKYNAISIEKRIISLEDFRVLESIYSGMSENQKKEAQPFPERLPKEHQESATKKQLADYNILAKKYNTMISKGGNIRIMKSDVDQLTNIYEIMSDEQKASAQPFPDFPEPPPAPNAPMVLRGEKSDIPPPPSPKVKKGDISNIPLPPTPPSPLDYVISMAKKGATFLYENKEISSNKAIDLLKNNKDLNIESRNIKKKTIVRITEDPVTIE